jgi:hypothetical protein
MQTPTAAPVQKVIGAAAGSGVGGSLAVILIWAASSFGHIVFPDYVALAITLLVSTIATFVAGYLVPPKASEIPVLAPVTAAAASK